MMYILTDDVLTHVKSRAFSDALNLIQLSMIWSHYHAQWLTYIFITTVCKLDEYSDMAIGFPHRDRNPVIITLKHCSGWWQVANQRFFVYRRPRERLVLSMLTIIWLLFSRQHTYIYRVGLTAGAAAACIDVCTSLCTESICIHIDIYRHTAHLIQQVFQRTDVTLTHSNGRHLVYGAEEIEV